MTAMFLNNEYSYKSMSDEKSRKRNNVNIIVLEFDLLHRNM